MKIISLRIGRGAQFGFSVFARKTRGLLAVIIAVVSTLAIPWQAYAHCEACFRVGASPVLTVSQSKARFNRVVGETPSLRGQPIEKSLAEAAKARPADFSRLFESNTNVVGTYCQGSNRSILFQDDAQNIYLAEFSITRPSEYRIILPEEIPDRFDEMFLKDLAPSSAFSALRVLDMGANGMAIMAEATDTSAHFVLSSADVATVTSGNPLPPNANADFSDWIKDAGLPTGKPVVIWGDPFLQANSLRRTRVLGFLTGLQKAYPRARLILDDPASGLNRAVEIISQTPLLKAGAPKSKSNLLLLTDAAERIQDFGLTGAYAERLESCGVTIVKYSKGKRYEGDRGIGVVVLTAHSEENFGKFVDELCSAGYFEKNLVMLNSCGTPLTKAMLEKINRECGAVATFGLVDSPNASRVEKLMVSLITALSAPTAGRASLYDAYNQALWSANMRGLWQTSWAGVH